MKNCTGSVLVTVLVVLSILVLSLTSIWRSSLYARDCALLRLKATQQQYSMEAFLQCVLLSIAQDYTYAYEAVSHSQDTLLLASDTWPLGLTTTCSIKAYARHIDNDLLICVVCDDVRYFKKKIGCRVHSDHTDFYESALKISAWYENDAFWA